MTKDVTLGEVVGKNVQRLRRLSGFGQADLGEEIGLGWTRDTVANIETGRRQLSIEELFELAAFFGIGAVEFFAGDPYTPAGLETADTEGWTLEVVRHNLRSELRAEDELADRLHGYAELRVYGSVLRHDPTTDIAKRLSVTSAVLNRHARSLWGRSVDDEYWERFYERTDPSMPRSRLSNIRGHVVRVLIKELEQKIQKKSRKES
jgi:transcriptional regulator with XRE-family HTH domain